MSKDNEITIDPVRATVEKIIRDCKISVEEVTGQKVRGFLGKGSAGYVGAHLQTIKQENVRARLLEEKNLSPHLKAALYDEIKRFTDNAREVALSEAEVTQEMFEEVCKQNVELEAEMADMSKRLSELQRDHADHARELSEELHSLHMEKGSLEARLADAQKDATSLRNELLEDRTRLATAIAKLEQAEGQRDDLQAGTDAQEKRLSEMEKEILQLRDTASKAEQHAELMLWKNQDLSQEREDLREKVGAAEGRAATAEAQLEILRKTPATKTTKSRPRSSSKATARRD